MQELIDHLKIFIYLEIGLWNELLSELPEQVDSMLLNVPKSGAVEFDSATWHYKKHGLGVCFEEKNGKRKVDFHSVKSGSSYFDAWGLSTYFGSLGGKGRKLLKSAEIDSGSIEQNLKTVLEKLKEQDVLQVSDGFYKFP
ncbi:MAG TPA: hypothetical protein DCE52_06115 [Rhodobacteraceae bacterium]|nr:hypothetical protein [Paracoccaceae bacterium]